MIMFIRNSRNWQIHRGKISKWLKTKLVERCGGAGVTSKGNAVSFGNDQIIEFFWVMIVKLYIPKY